MFAYLEGRVTEKRADSMVVEAGGVGFLVSATPQTISRVAGGEGRSRVYTKVIAKKDDVWEIYGFATREEKEMFEKLTSVSGVGPKMALGVLSVLSVQDLALAIVSGDLKALKAAPGIGAKTAQRLLLELRDKVSDDELVGDFAVGGAPSAAVEGSAAQDALAALLALGYTQAEAATALSRVKDKGDTAEELIRQALRAMAQM
ncbi:MAG: Holliday junction branch migration protein RuvA [Candidatus Spyradocola sp.]|jgi:Holliday junction DNA helicase RuvA